MHLLLTFPALAPIAFSYKGNGTGNDKMAELAALPLFTDSFSADTQHLDDAEVGRYMRLLIITWRSPGCRIPNDPDWIAKRLRVDPLNYSKLIAPIISEFYKDDGAGWLTQKRLKKEWEYTIEKREKNASAAKARWQKEKVPCERISKRNAPTPTPTPTPSYKPPTPLEGGTASPGVFKKTGGKGGASAPGGTFDIETHLSDDDRAAAKASAPGADIHWLIREYNASVNSSKRDRPARPAAAFIGWCKVFYKNNKHRL